MLDFIKKPVILGRVYSIADLNTSKIAFSSIDIRQKIPILIIDDNGFIYKETLRDEKYNLTCINVIEDLSAAAEYPIVISDVRGVGTKFDPEREGVFVVRELKKKYPFKQYAIYSVSSYSLDLMNNDLDGVARIKKDASLEMWRAYLDELIRRASDPKENWKTMRDFLLKKDVSLKEVLLLESNFVDIYNNRPSDMKNFPEERSFPNLNKDIRAIIQNMIAGGLLYFLGA